MNTHINSHKHIIISWWGQVVGIRRAP